MNQMKRLTTVVAVLSLAVVGPVIAQSNAQTGAVGSAQCECDCHYKLGFHDCEIRPYNPMTGPVHNDFKIGTCAEHGHTFECEPFSPETQGELATAIARGDGHELRAILASTDGKAYFNAQRRAIQIKGCRGRIIANIPLKSEVAEILAID